MALIAIVAGLAVAVLLIMAPFFLPWPRRLRWLITVSNVPDPWGFGTTPWLGLDEMTLESVVPCPGGLLVLGLSGRPLSTLQSLWLDGPTDEQAERLEGWTTAGTPLLQMGAADGSIALHGPTSCVSGLRQVPSSRELAARS